jgi:hypothetical protein
MNKTKYRNKPKGCIYFYDKRFFREVLLKGEMEVLEDIKILYGQKEDFCQFYRDDSVV